MPPELQQLAEETARSAKGRVSKISWQGKTLWVKKAVPNKAKAWHQLQRGAALLLPMPILRATTSTGGPEGLQHEAVRIEEFTKAGFRAPRVWGLTDDYIVLEDLGMMAEKKLRTQPQSFEADVAACAALVARLHKAGLAHGRAKLNDIVFQEDGGIGFIDFEEDVYGANIPLPALQARDIWLFSCSLARFAPQDAAVVEKAFAVYRAGNEDAAVFAELKKLLSALRPFQKLMKPLIPHMARDVQRAYAATLSLTALLL